MLKSFAVATALLALTAASPALAATSAADGAYIVADIRPPSPDRDVGEPKSRDTRPTPQKPVDPAKRPTPRPQPDDGSSKPASLGTSRAPIAAAIAVLIGAIVSIMLRQGARRRAA